MHWERKASELIEHLGMQVGHIFDSAIEGGGILGKNHVTPAQKVLDEEARKARRKSVNNLTRQRAEEIAEENRKA